VAKQGLLLVLYRGWLEGDGGCSDEVTRFSGTMMGADFFSATEKDQCLLNANEMTCDPTITCLAVFYRPWFLLDSASLWRDTKFDDFPYLKK
jgi:hypothetical protein